MASLIPGYEYDIFISYRQKDNKYDGWVTEFVDNLKRELEATFKEEVSVYFDINPHDGLLETHDVDASLKEKLKCLVFIPVISRTYCDPKSFAWEHEFRAFVESASIDQFGLKVKLPNGNVANRVLPVRIHDLDKDDINLCESVLGGVLRGVEFIYKEPGVNKPLTSEDDEKKNLNKTKYRIQINKIANAIKDIVSGLMAGEVVSGKEKPEPQLPWEEAKKEKRITPEEKRAGFNKIKLLSYIISAVFVLLLLVVYVYPRFFKRDTLEKLRSSGEKISIVVMPFQNMTNDTTWNIWQDGIQDNLITSLSNSGELTVRHRESVTSLLQSKGLTNYASLSPYVAGVLSQKLDANVFIYGSINQAGQIIRLNAQLIDSKTKEVFKSFQINATEEKILSAIDTLSQSLRNFLVISVMKKQTSAYERPFNTSSPEAYKYFLLADKALDRNDLKTSVDLYSRAVAIDSNFIPAIIFLSRRYFELGLYDEAKKWCLKAYEKRDQVSLGDRLMAEEYHAELFETPNEQIKYLKQLQDEDDQEPAIYYLTGIAYRNLFQYDKAIPEYEKALDICNKWEIKPMYVWNYLYLGEAYHKIGQYEKEKKLYKKAEKDFPDDVFLIFRQAILSFTEKDTIAANRYIGKLSSILKENNWSDAGIKGFLADLYSEAGVYNKAEEYYRQALSLEPEKPERLSSLAWFLIDKDRNLNEGLELVDKALELRPDNYGDIDTKGWGLYKKGKYKEALEQLEKSWSLKPEYYHVIYLHLEEVKKALAAQK